MKRPSKILGIALGPAGALVAEVSSSGKARKATRLAEFAFPAGTSLDAPAALAPHLAAFLKRQNISERDVALGLPAKWLLTRKKDLPPASSAVAAQSLRLQAETDFAGDQDLVSDYVGEADPSSPSSVLLVATPRATLDNALALAKAAGLRVRAVTATGAALARAAGGGASAPDVLVSVSAAGAELVAHHHGRATHLRHLGADAADPAPLAGEIRRTLAALPRNGTPPGLSLFHRPNDPLGDVLTQRLSVPVSQPPLRSLVGEAPSTDSRFAPAVAVAVAALDGPPVDFLHTRLAPPKPKTNRRLYTWLAVLGVLAVGLIAYAVYDVQQKDRELTDLRAKVRAATPQADKDRLAAARLAAARSQMTLSPRYLNCLRDLVTMLPDQGITWATNFTLHPEPKDPAAPGAPDTIRGEISFKTADRRADEALYRKVLENPLFSDVRINNISQNPTTGELTRSISFKYRPGGGAAPAATRPAASPPATRRPDVK